MNKIYLLVLISILVKSCVPKPEKTKEPQFSVIDSLCKYQDCFGEIIQFERDGITLLIGDKEIDDQAVLIALDGESHESRIERYAHEEGNWLLKDTITTMLGYGMRLTSEDVNADGVMDLLIRYYIGISGNTMQIPFLRNGNDRTFRCEPSFNQPNLVYDARSNQFWSVSYNGGPCNGNSYSQFKCVGDSLYWVESYRVRIIECTTGRATIHHSRADTVSTIVYDGYDGDDLDSVLACFVPLGRVH